MGEITTHQKRSARGPFRAARMPQIAWTLSAAPAAALVMLGPPAGIPSASAAPCADIEVVFARGTFEPAGIGATGEAFVEALRSRAGGRSVDAYAVNYPATLQFSTAADGVIDAGNRVRDIAANCPNTQMVLGGFSQGAAVIGYITEDVVPAGFALPQGLTGPMAPEMADHVAAVALFGKPSNGFLNTINAAAPPVTVGPLYAGKAIELCIGTDPVCSPGGGDMGSHSAYATNGMATQAADFAAGLLSGANIRPA